MGRVVNEPCERISKCCVQEFRPIPTCMAQQSLPLSDLEENAIDCKLKNHPPFPPKVFIWVIFVIHHNYLYVSLFESANKVSVDVLALSCSHKHFIVQHSTGHFRCDRLGEQYTMELWITVHWRAAPYCLPPQCDIHDDESSYGSGCHW